MKLDLPSTGGKFARLDDRLIVSASDPHRYFLAELLNDSSIRVNSSVNPNTLLIDNILTLF